jgi:hypothetical protein
MPDGIILKSCYLQSIKGVQHIFLTSCYLAKHQRNPARHRTSGASVNLDTIYSLRHQKGKEESLGLLIPVYLINSSYKPNTCSVMQVPDPTTLGRSFPSQSDGIVPDQDFWTTRASQTQAGETMSTGNTGNSELLASENEGRVPSTEQTRPPLHQDQTLEARTRVSWLKVLINQERSTRASAQEKALGDDGKIIDVWQKFQQMKPAGQVPIHECKDTVKKFSENVTQLKKENEALDFAGFWQIIYGKVFQLLRSFTL